jgi:hypothetical protein
VEATTDEERSHYRMPEGLSAVMVAANSGSGARRDRRSNVAAQLFESGSVYSAVTLKAADCYQGADT